jgi:hypothetical protein
MQRTRDRRRPHTRWRYKVKENLNIIGIKNKQAMARNDQEWRKTVTDVKVHSGL